MKLIVRVIILFFVVSMQNHIFGQQNPPPLSKLVISENDSDTLVIPIDRKYHVIDCDTFIMGSNSRLVVPNTLKHLKIVSRHTILGDHCRIECLNDVHGKAGKNWGNKRPNTPEAGKDGQHGAKGEDGGHGSVNTNVTLNFVIHEIKGNGLIVQTHGGNGGLGAKGQNGGHGGRARCNGMQNGGNGGNGGKGGDGGNGGKGGNLILFYSWTNGSVTKPIIELRAKKGKRGIPGLGGSEGHGGPGKDCGLFKLGGGAGGKKGKVGLKGKKGKNGFMKTYFGNDESIANFQD